MPSSNRLDLGRRDFESQAPSHSTRKEVRDALSGVALAGGILRTQQGRRRLGRVFN